MPPVWGPDDGVMSVMVGADCVPVYVKALAMVAVSPSPFVMLTSTGPAGPGGDVTVSCVALLRMTFVPAFGPKCTIMLPGVWALGPPVRKFVPVTITVVPPLAGPFDGETLAIVGGPK